MRDNIFANCRKHAIEFPNEHNFSDGNLFAELPAGYLKLKDPPPELLLDLPTWREYYGWEQHCRMADLQLTLDPESLCLSVKAGAELTNITAGPFPALESFEAQPIDPRYSPRPAR